MFKYGKAIAYRDLISFILSSDIVFGYVTVKYPWIFGYSVFNPLSSTPLQFSNK